MSATRLGPGYLVVIDGFAYQHRSQRPYTLTEAWAEVEGCGHASIITTAGRTVLSNAGSMYVRTNHVPRLARYRRLRRVGFSHEDAKTVSGLPSDLTDIALRREAA